jgi:hypothetical protein
MRFTLASLCRGVTAIRAMMVLQLGLAMMAPPPAGGRGGGGKERGGGGARGVCMRRATCVDTFGAAEGIICVKYVNKPLQPYCNICAWSSSLL